MTIGTKVVITAEDQTGAAFASVSGGIAGLGASIGVFTSLTQNAISAFGEIARQSIGLYKDQVGIADSMDEMSVRMAMSIKDMVAWKAAAEMNGTTLDSMAAGTRMLAKHMTEHGDALRKAGITSRDANEAFMQLSDLFMGMTDPVQRLDLATRIFGRGMGQQLLPALVQGREAMDEIRRHTDGYGEALTRLSPEAQKLNDSLYLMGIHVKTVAADGVSPLVRDLNTLLPELDDVKTKAGLMFGILDAGVESLRAVAVFGANVAFVFRAVGTEIGGMAAQMAALGRLDFKAFSAIGEAMKEDAARARKEFDEMERRLLALGKNVPGSIAGRDIRDARDRGLTDAPALERALEAARRAKELREGLGPDGKAGAGRAPKTPLQKMLDIGERNLAASKAAEYVAADDDEEARLGAHKRQMESLRLQAQETSALQKHAEKIKDTVEPLRVLRREIDEVNKLREAGSLTAEQASLAEDDLSRKFAKQRESMLDLKHAGVDSFGGIKDAIESMGNKAADTSADMLMGGKASFTELINSMLKDMARLQAKKMLDPVTKGATDWLSKLFGGGSGGAGSMSGNGSVQGNADYVWDLHSGGIAGAGEGSGQHLRSLAMFAKAPKYHGGGLAGDEIPAVLKRGEGVFTPGQMRAMGGGGSVVIDMPVTINAPGADASVIPQINAALAALEQRIYRNVPGITARQQLRNRISPMTA